MPVGGGSARICRVVRSIKLVTYCLQICFLQHDAFTHMVLQKSSGSLQCSTMSLHISCSKTTDTPHCRGSCKHLVHCGSHCTSRANECHRLQGPAVLLEQSFCAHNLKHLHDMQHRCCSPATTLHTRTSTLVCRSGRLTLMLVWARSTSLGCFSNASTLPWGPASCAKHAAM